ncbi:MAG: glycosyltransferase family 2 protein [Candidatus Eisenbacteria bacterium]|nr:glycosyltransferase family 2 protein [Candidatus Eisenbacteria bacterium]
MVFPGTPEGGVGTHSAVKPENPDRIGLLGRFLLANAVALGWAALSVWLAQRWSQELAVYVGPVPAWATVLFIAIIPGYLNMLLLMSLALYRQDTLKLDILYPPVTILIAAYNEEDCIRDTMRGIRQQEYANQIEVILVDDGSTDRTVELARELGPPNLKVLPAPHGGKANALNLGLEKALFNTVVTIDADTFLYRNAVQRIVARLLSHPNNAAVAGHVLAKNERASRMARLQSWDYMLAIASVKRQQGLFRGTLVAQGAFSAFRRNCLREVKGWQDRIGEDIVLTWALLSRGYRVDYEPTAFSFTNVPTHLRGFARQRQRWARGMIEGFKSHLDIIWKQRSYSAFFVALDLLFPLIDFFYTFVFLPGVVLACFGYRFIAGPLTLLVLPITLLIVLVMFRSQKRFLDQAGLKIRRNPWGLVGYVMIYQVLMSPICVAGYFKEAFGWRRKW